MKNITKAKIAPTNARTKIVKITKVNPANVNLRSSLVTSQVQKVTTVHGTSHVGSKKGKGLILWCAIMLANVALTAYFLIVIRQKFNENQIVTQVDANCKVSQVPFPAVSICNFNLVSLKESANIARILEQKNIPKQYIEEFFNSLYYLTTFNNNSRKLHNFTDIMTILKQHYFTMDTIMEEVHQKCENLLVYCTFNRKPKKCAEIFALIKTLDGYCCAFNYAGVNDASEVHQAPIDDDLEYYYESENENEDSRIIATSESGSNTGLSVVLNIEPNDYPSWSTTPYYGAKIIVSDPKDYPETTILYRYISIGEWVEIKVEGMLYQSAPELRGMTPLKRNCWFFDELLLVHTDRYSYETCTTECRMKSYMESCGCIPFKYPKDKSSRVCELEDLKCLNNVTGYTVHNAKNVDDCNSMCYVECRDNGYTITSDLAPFVPDEFPQNITQNINTSELAAIQVYYGKSNCNCYKKSLLIDVNYFIATYGGVFSLSFGASILTLFELGFIFCTATAKLIWRAITNVYRKKIQRQLALENKLVFNEK